MDKDLLPKRPDPGAQLTLAGLAANEAAAANRFANYRLRRAAHTLRRQDADLALFGQYLREVGALHPEPSPYPLPQGEGEGPHPAPSPALRPQGEGQLPSPPGGRAGDEGAWNPLSPAAWNGVTWGLVEGFTRWLLLQGYSVSSVNVRLSTVKTYCKLATQAGAIPAGEYALIRLVQGYSRKEARRVDQRRAAADVPQRVGLKKAEPVALTPPQAAQLKQQPNTPQGRRDALLLCLLLDHGLRAGEVTLLRVEDFDLAAGIFRFHRPKVDKSQTHRLSPDALKAARAYLQQDALPSGKLLRASRKDGSLRHAGLSGRAVSARVEF